MDFVKADHVWLVFLDKVTSTVNEGHSADVIYLDFAKAFDKVPHQRLLQKLEGHGIQGKLLDWISSWLTNRRQRVCIQGKFSSWILVTSGVPQGSVLGPRCYFLFSLTTWTWVSRTGFWNLLTILKSFLNSLKLKTVINYKKTWSYCINGR